MRKYLLATVTELNGEYAYTTQCVVSCDALQAIDELQDKIAKGWRGEAVWSEDDNLYWGACGTAIEIPVLRVITNDHALVLCKYLPALTY